MGKMKFDPVNPESDRPIHQQLREQIIYRITTGQPQVGDAMPGVRTVARQLDICVNTVSSVYKELVEEGWLLERRGSHHIVINRTRDDDLRTQFEDLDKLVDHTIRLALKNGHPLQIVAARLRDRLLDQPPDHLLIVEPERGLGQLMREEIRQILGFTPPAFSVQDLAQDSSKIMGAVLLTPIHVQDLLEFIPPQKRHTVPLFFAPPDEHAALVRDLPQASVVGMASISPAAIETAGNYLASARGDSHTSREFLIEWPVGKDGPHFSDFSEYKRIYVRKSAGGSVQSDGGVIIASSASSYTDEADSRPLSAADLNSVDVLFCDSIAYQLVKHRRRVRWQLLSKESLEAVAARSKSLRHDLDEREAERRTAVAKLEAERRAAQEIAIAKRV
jgi:DNA-binding transcriptional regulator YhcF (GntR family)